MTTTPTTHEPPRARHLTVSYLPAPWYDFAPCPDPLPYLRLRGRWLERAGFAVGAKIRVRVEPHRLILEVIDEEPPGAPRASDSLISALDMGPHIR